jgi:hypothetical protein
MSNSHFGLTVLCNTTFIFLKKNILINNTKPLRSRDLALRDYSAPRGGAAGGETDATRWRDPVAALRAPGGPPHQAPGARGNLALPHGDGDSDGENAYMDELFEAFEAESAPGGESEPEERCVPPEAFGTEESPFRVGEVKLAEQA